MTTDYQPIDCQLHSEYELAIIKQHKLRISWQDNQGKTHNALVRPLDLITRQHQEFMLVVTPDEQIIELRLDQITQSQSYPSK